MSFLLFRKSSKSIKEENKNVKHAHKCSVNQEPKAL